MLSTNAQEAAWKSALSKRKNFIDLYGTTIEEIGIPQQNSFRLFYDLQLGAIAIVDSDGVRVGGIDMWPNFSRAETPSGKIDGVNKTFTLAYPPSPPSSLMLFNGLIQEPNGNDFSLSGALIIFTLAPLKDSRLLAWYQY